MLGFCQFISFSYLRSMEKKKEITFDTFIRGFIASIVIVGIIMLLNRLSAVLLPFFLAWLVAYILFPVVKFFQYKCHLHFRIAGIICTFITVGIVLTGLGWLMIPPIIEEGIRVKDLLLTYVSNNTDMNNIPDMISDFIREHVTVKDVKALITQEGFIDSIKQGVPKVWAVISQSISIVSSVFSLTMVVLYTLFILLDYEKLSKGWVSLLPVRYRDFSTQLMADIEQGMNLYFRGQGMVALCVGILFSIGFLIIDFPMAIGLGMFIGLLNMVPYLQLLGFVPTILLAVIKAADTGQNFWMIMLLALIVFAVVQIIQDTFLTPKIMGHVTGLNSAIILLSLSIWGSLLGILGMIIALPLTTLLITYYQKYVINKAKQEE